MRTYLGFAPVLLLAGVLATGGASTIQAQDTSRARNDSSGYESYGPGDTSAGDTGQADTGATGYGDTATAGKRTATAADSVVCMDGSSSARTDGCLRNGGIDWDSTEAAMKARGSPADTSSN
jgi:hypothetical protein